MTGPHMTLKQQCNDVPLSRHEQQDGPRECKVVTLHNYFLAAFFSCFAAFFSFGVLAEAFLSVFLLSCPLAMAFLPIV